MDIFKARPLNQPFDYPRCKVRGLPFDKLKALSSIEGLKVDTERRLFAPVLKAGVWRRRSIKSFCFLNRNLEVNQGDS